MSLRLSGFCKLHKIPRNLLTINTPTAWGLKNQFKKGTLPVSRDEWLSQFRLEVFGPKIRLEDLLLDQNLSFFTKLNFSIFYFLNILSQYLKNLFLILLWSLRRWRYLRKRWFHCDSSAGVQPNCRLYVHMI